MTTPVMAPISHKIENSKNQFGFITPKKPIELKIRAAAESVLWNFKNRISSRLRTKAAIIVEVAVKKSPHKK